MKRLILLGLLGLALTSVGGLITGTTDSTAVASAEISASDVERDCYRVRCVHTAWVPCRHIITVRVGCYCHSARWHYERRAAHNGHTIRPHAFDWVCYCGYH